MLNKIILFGKIHVLIRHDFSVKERFFKSQIRSLKRSSFSLEKWVNGGERTHAERTVSVSLMEFGQRL